MVELKLGLKTVDLPYTLRLHGVTEEMFDELVNEDMKAELLDGEMIVHSPAAVRHDDVSGFLRTLSRVYARRRKKGAVLGPDSLIHLATCRLFAPDLFFVERARVPKRWPKVIEGCPDWISEVLSSSNKDDDLEVKRPAYQEARAKELWFIDYVEEMIIVDTLGKKGYMSRTVRSGKLRSSTLDGFWIDVGWLWSEPLPDELDCLQLILGEKR